MRVTCNIHEYVLKYSILCAPPLSPFCAWCGARRPGPFLCENGVLNTLVTSRTFFARVSPASPS